MYPFIEKSLEDFLVKSRENHQLEYKKSLDNIPKDFWETYSAFCNTEGGIVYLGIQEGADGSDNILSGVNNPDKVSKDLWNMVSNRNKVSFNALQNANVNIYRCSNQKHIIEVKINVVPWAYKPVYLDNDPSRCFRREGDGDKRITPEKIAIYQRNAHHQMDSRLLSGFTIEDLDKISVASFKERVSIRYPENEYDTMSQEEFLLEMGCIKRDRSNNQINITAGCLLFLGKYNSIREIYPFFHLDYINKTGDNPRWKDRVATDVPDGKFQMNIFNFFNIVYQKLINSFSNQFELDKSHIRVEDKKFEEAIREAFVNCLAHADYDMGSPSTKIELRDRCIYFTNPGIMLIPINDFVNGGNSVPRNEIIMKLFRLLGASERQGMGGPQLFKSANQNSFRNPEIITTLEKTDISLWYVDLIESYPELNEEEKSVFSCIVKSHIPLSYREIKERTELTEHKIRKAITLLIDEKKISKIGNGPATAYAVNFDSKDFIANLNLRFYVSTL